MKRLCVLLLACLLLSGCACQTAAPVPAVSAEPPWTPPAAPPAGLSEEALSIQSALDLCRSFSEDVSAACPQLNIALSADDLAYYERRLSEADDQLRAELAQSIVSLRQQAYREIETFRKTGNPLPDGLEEALAGFEAALMNAGW